MSKNSNQVQHDIVCRSDVDPRLRLNAFTYRRIPTAHHGKGLNTYLSIVLFLKHAYMYYVPLIRFGTCLLRITRLPYSTFALARNLLWGRLDQGPNLRKLHLLNQHYSCECG